MDREYIDEIQMLSKILLKEKAKRVVLKEVVKLIMQQTHSDKQVQ